MIAMKEKPIFTVTTVYGDPATSSRTGPARCWGWWPTLKGALKVLHNADHQGLMFESAPYAYAVVEEVTSGWMSGIHGDGARPAWWFRIEGGADEGFQLTAIGRPPRHFKNRQLISMG